ncbi:MAG TPA: type II toxin-antitoxin system VapC family toxin [Vicinamibacterales bacterium]|nr:type II toxin-antitoxin system VapC family toxin [Vicinamibacterales bacterium]
MKALVIDGSAALGFLMSDEQPGPALEALDALERGVPAFVPAHWPLEVANGLLMAERRKRATRATVVEALHVVLSLLPIEIDPTTSAHVAGETMGLARQYGLTLYDAAYLELAMRRGATLATGDAELARAAKKAGVGVL